MNNSVSRHAGMFILLSPRYRAAKNRFSRLQSGDGLKAMALGLLGAAFWVFMYTVSVRVLIYFRSIEGLGDLLALRLLSMVLLTFFSLLLFSNVVTSLSTFYLSGELEILHSAPIPAANMYRAKFVETLIDSSWMTLIYGFPVFLAYGAVFKAGFSYYTGMLLMLIPFLVIPAALGIIISMLLVSAFPARRAKDIIVLLGLILFVALYVLFRFLRPEKLVDPDTFPTLVQYLTAMRGPATPFLPSAWASDVLASLLRKGSGEHRFFLLMLWSTALAGAVIGEHVCLRTYASGWSRAQEGKRARLSRSRSADMLFRLLTLPLPRRVRALVTKDLKLFFRDTSQWSQLFLLVGLMVVYIYSFRLLPMDRAAMPSFFLQNLISFLNLGMVGFVTAAVAVRFVFPAVSLEGRSFWIIRSSPLSLRRFLWAKFWSSLLPLLVLAEILAILSNTLLRVTPFMMWLSVLTVLFMTCGITALGVGIGALFPRFRYENVAQIPTGFGGIIYMLVTMTFIGAIIALEAWPVYRIFMAEAAGISLLTLSRWPVLFLPFALAAVLMFAAVFIPLRSGIRRLEESEF